MGFVLIISVGDVQSMCQRCLTDFMASHQGVYGVMVSLFERFYGQYSEALKAVISDILDDDLFYIMTQDMIQRWVKGMDGHGVAMALDVLRDEALGQQMKSAFLGLIAQQCGGAGGASMNENIHVLFFLLFKAACDRKINNPALFYYRGELFLGELRRDAIEEGVALTQSNGKTLFDENHAWCLLDFHYAGVMREGCLQFKELLSTNKIFVYDSLSYARM